MMRSKNPTHVHAFIDARGKPRNTLRRPGFPSVSLPGLPWSPIFMAAYESAMAGEPILKPVALDQIKAGSLRALTIAYFASTPYLTLAPNTRHLYRARLDQLCQLRDSKGVALGDKSAVTMRSENVEELLAKKADKPGAYNEQRKVMRALMQYAVKAKIRTDDRSDQDGRRRLP